MTWGDTSNTSADLALSLLWNHYYVHGFLHHLYEIEINGQTILVSRESEPAFRLYMPFLREVVSRWPVGEPWQITTEEIAAWIATQPLEVLESEERARRVQTLQEKTRLSVTYREEEDSIL